MAQWRGFTFPIGFHIGNGGNAEGLVENYLAPLDAAGIRWFLKSVDAYPLNAVEIAKASGIPHTIVWRSTFTDVPDYEHEQGYTGAAQQHFSDTLQRIPPEFDPDIVWVEAINEVDKNRANWLGGFGYVWSNMAISHNLKSLMFGWSSGEPEPEHWLVPNMADYLRFASENRDKVGIALHEYSYSVSDIFRWYPWLVGRYRQLFNACDTLGIPRVSVAITEWGWEYEDVPGVEDAKWDIDQIAQEYVKHNEIMGAGLWYLGPGFGGIANQAQQLIEPVGEMALNWAHYQEHVWPLDDGEPPPPPPPDGENLLENGSFEEGNYKWNGIDEINVPNGWDFWHADENTPNPIDQNTWSKFRQPEVVNPSKAFFPPEEHEIFFLDGEHVVKVFKGSGSIYFSLLQTVSLEPGQYLLTMPVFADLVKDYADNGEKIWADDPEGRDGLAKIHFGSYVSDWLSLQPGQYNVLTNLASVPEAGEYTVGVEIMLPFALVQNGVFMDAFTLEAEASPPPPTGCIDTSQFTKYHILRPQGLNENQWAWLRDAMENGVTIPGIGHVVVGYEGWSHLDAIGAIRASVMDGFENSRLIVVDGHLIGTGLDETWMEQNCAFMVPYTVYMQTGGEEGLVIHDIVNDLPTHPTDDYANRPASDVTTLVVHHTAGGPFQPVEDIARYHVNEKGWPGIAYHYVIDGAGKVYLTNYHTTWSYHANHANGYSIGIVMQGHFGSNPPPEAQLLACEALVEHLRVTIPSIREIIPHREAPGSSTVCPGDTWESWWYRLEWENPPEEFAFKVWPTEYRHVTQEFGANPEYYKKFSLPGHDGVDIRGPEGTDIYNVADGTVYRVHTDPSSHNYGLHVRVEHDNGHKTIYAHLSKITTGLKVGHRVPASFLLGLSGNTGNSQGAHLHLGYKREGLTYTDPDGNEWPYNLHDPTPFLASLCPPCFDSEPPPPAGLARLGLHASADGGLASGELEAFTAARIELVKILSSTPGEDVTKLANALPDVPFVIRAFLSFGGREVSPQQFFDWTVSDVRRAIDRLKDRQTVVELHNEPNLYAEGFGANWTNGAEYAIWANEVLQKYKSAFAGYEFVFPGLSPGGDISGIRYDSNRFMAEAAAAIGNHDFLGVHAYWAANWPMELAFGTVDHAIGMHPSKPIIVTEASNNKRTTSQEGKANEYITFVDGLKERPTVFGVTYFVASASHEGWGWSVGSGETWVGTSIPGIVGQRS